MGQNEPENQQGPSVQKGLTGATRDPLIGQVLGGRFRVQSLIARGGMGKVYRAEQAPLNRPVALKILDPSTGQEDEGSVFRERFFLEASTCAKLSHPNTVRIYDYGSTWDDVFYIAMEYLEGETLNRVVRQGGPVSAKRMISIAKQICGSLHEAHQHGMIHRDLKPSNVFLTKPGSDEEFSKVLDFGLVKNVLDDAEMTDAGRLLGSPMYMSPEQVRCEVLDRRTDIYSLGMLMYVCLTGKRPFKKTQSISVLLSQISEQPPSFGDVNPNVTVPASLEWVVMRCLEKEAPDRFADMSELVRALKACEIELSSEVDGPIRLQLVQGKTIVPAGFDALDSGEMSMQSEMSEAVDASNTFQFESPDSSDGTQKAVIAAGFGAAGVLFAVALLFVFLAIGLLTWGALRVPDNTEPSYPIEGLKVPDPVHSQEPVSSELEGLGENIPVIEDKQIKLEIPDEVDRSNKTSKRRAKSRQKRPQSGTLRGSSIPAELPNDETVEDSVPPKEESNWKQGSDIRDPWAGER